jgi:Cu(I)/Ag(I) efflux system membrane fusion protein
VDLSSVWVEADIYESELAAIRPGTGATVTLDAYPGESFPGRVTFVYPYVGDATRTVKVRVALANRGGRLKPGMFANVEVATPARTALTVPTDAVVDSGRAQFVFVSQGDGYFEPRQIEAGRRVEGRIEVRKGLAAGDQVASGATFFIDSESQLRAAMQGFEEAPALAGGGGGEAASALRIEFATIPDPPRNGDNTWQVTVRDAGGNPVTDATVDVRIYMAPMPSMNMPAMWSDARLLHTADGVYRGQANVSMAGRWDVTVTVSRDGQRLGRRMFAIVAR